MLGEVLKLKKISFGLIIRKKEGKEMLIADQFETTDGRIVTKFLIVQRWEVCTGKVTRTFDNALDYQRYMTK